MSSHEAVLATLLEIVSRRRNDVLERATDWVIGAAPDLQGKRPREETRRLVDRVISTNLCVLQAGNRAPLLEFIDQVTSYRAAHEFRVSTILRGFLSFARGLDAIMREEAVADEVRLFALTIVDDIYHEAMFEISDAYGGKLVATVKARRDELEQELGEKRKELDSLIATVDAQRVMLTALSSPILRIWNGILLVPFIGEISPERAEQASSMLLKEILAQSARVVLVDVTGLSVVDAYAAQVLGSMLRAMRLVGAEGMVVGVRGDVARVLVSMGELFHGTRTFATLADGLHHALRNAAIRARPSRQSP